MSDRQTRTVSGRRSAVLNWLARGPFAIAASALQGGMNYAIVLFLSYGASLTATGEYRTYFSYYSLCALACLVETNKPFIRSIVTGDRAATTALFINRLVFAMGLFVLVLLGWLIGRMTGHPFVPDMLLPIAALSAVGYPFDVYISNLQAERSFHKLFALECIKYGGAIALFIGMIRWDWSVGAAILAQLLFMALCHVTFFLLIARPWIRLDVMRAGLGAMLKAPASRQARTYSLANMFPASLEHIDKLLVGAVFGLEFLGVYTLAYSTGRFLYNILKPAMYVYYRRFVDEMPGWPLLRRVSLIFTLLGGCTAILFAIGIATIPALARFESGKWVTIILFCGYGLGILHAVYSQAFSLNKDSDAAHSFNAHLRATLASLVLLGSAMISPRSVALVLLALQYPLRDGLSALLMDRYRRAGMKKNQP